MEKFIPVDGPIEHEFELQEQGDRKGADYPAPRPLLLLSGKGGRAVQLAGFRNGLLALSSGSTCLSIRSRRSSIWRMRAMLTSIGFRFADISSASKIGRAHVCTLVTNSHLVCLLPLAKTN